MTADNQVTLEPDMSWFDIAVDRKKQVFVIDYAPGWADFGIDHCWWEDVFDSDPPIHLDAGFYRWSGFKIGYWHEDEGINVTGGTFARTQPAINSGGEVERVTKAILFEDCGNTADWEENTNLGVAALAAMDRAPGDELATVMQYVRAACSILAPCSGDAPGTPTRDALEQINAALHSQARAKVQPEPRPVEAGEGE